MSWQGYVWLIATPLLAFAALTIYGLRKGRQRLAPRTYLLGTLDAQSKHTKQSAQYRANVIT